MQQALTRHEVAMWLDAIDLLMERMKAGGVAFETIVAISGAGQVICVGRERQ
jgi:sugar (pentulose or hexulose) kinase